MPGCCSIVWACLDHEEVGFRGFDDKLAKQGEEDVVFRSRSCYLGWLTRENNRGSAEKIRRFTHNSLIGCHVFAY